MKDFVRAVFLLSALHLSAGAGVALAETVSVQEADKAEEPAEAADARKPDEAKPAEKPAEAGKAEKPVDAKKPAEVKKPAGTAKSPKLTKSKEIYQSSPKFFGTKLAVGGYDTVAYHQEGKPVIGTDTFTYTWKDATWRFSSKENLDAFVASPEKYAPQYGGYCAYAVAHNGLSPGNPLHWKIVDGKLYLNIDGSVQTKWERGQDGFIKRSEANWPKVLPTLQPKPVKK